jgi:hypothetical protein
MELSQMTDSLQQLVMAQTETIKTQNQTIQNQNLQIQGMQSQLMTVIQMAQVKESGSHLVKENFPDNWEEPQSLEEEEEILEPITFPEIFTTETSEQPAIIGEDDGRNDE